MNAIVVLALFATQPAPPASKPPPPTAVDLTVASLADARVTFKLPTSAGELEGSLPLTRFDVRGVNGRFRFAMELWADPQRASVGDAVLDDLLRRFVLKGTRVRVTSSERVAPSTKDDATPLEKDRFGAAVWIDLGNGAPKYRVVRYLFEPDDKAGGKLTAVHKVELKALGITELPHPFIEASGPLELRLVLPLVPRT